MIRYRLIAGISQVFPVTHVPYATAQLQRSVAQPRACHGKDKKSSHVGQWSTTCKISPRRAEKKKKEDPSVVALTARRSAEGDGNQWRSQEGTRWGTLGVGEVQSQRRRQGDVRCTGQLRYLLVVGEGRGVSESFFFLALCLFSRLLFLAHNYVTLFEFFSHGG